MQSVSIQTGGSEKRRSIVGMCGLDKGAQLLIIGIGGQRAVRCQHKGDVLHPLQGIAGQRSDLFGLVLTESLFEAKLAQYPDALAGNADFIRQTWVGGRTTDCVGLIKGYGWLDAETEEIVYNTNGMPDISANEMYHSATASGPIDTIPETPGLAVWHEGHIGVYIGNGEVVEAMGTRYGVVKTKLEGARWTHWLKIPYISYD